MITGAGRSLVVAAPGSVSLAASGLSSPAEGELSVRPKLVGLCGTDLEIIDGQIDPAYVRYPIVLGHEWCGVVEGGQEGEQLVVGEGVVPCGHCQRCRQGRTNLCETYDEVGFTRDGAAAPEIRVPRSLVHVLGPAADPAAAVLAEPAAVVYQALRRAAPAPGWRVLVIGDGTIGLLSTLLSGLWSPAVVDVVGTRADQAELASRAGADSFRPPAPAPGADYDLVIEAAGSPAAVVSALAAARRGGVVLLLGLPTHGHETPFAVADAVNRDLAIHASFSYTSSAFAEVVALLSSRRLDPSFIVTHRFPLEEWSQALEVLRQPIGERGKVVLEMEPG